METLKERIIQNKYLENEWTNRDGKIKGEDEERKREMEKERGENEGEGLRGKSYRKEEN